MSDSAEGTPPSTREPEEIPAEPVERSAPEPEPGPDPTEEPLPDDGQAAQEEDRTADEPAPEAPLAGADADELTGAEAKAEDPAEDPEEEQEEPVAKAEEAEAPEEEEPEAKAEEAEAPEEEEPEAKVEETEAAEEEEPEAKAEEAEAPEEEEPAGAAEEEPKLPDDPVSLRLLAALESGEPVEGKVFGWNQGGYHVLIDGLLAFCPRSEIELGNPKSPKKYIEKTYPFRVIEHRPEGNRFVVSRAKVLEEKQAERRAAVQERLSPGVELEGRVTSLTGFGAFVDLGGGIEGLVHVSELSHRSVDQPKELVKKGQTVKVKVLKIEEGGDRISLSMKALEKNPWAEFAEEHPRGSEFTGKITGKTDFGIFVEVAPGMEGLVHVSALPPGASLEDDGFEEGEEVSGWVKETEVGRQRISLSLRPVPTGDPWRDVRESYPEGEVVTGTVEEIAPFGVFINLEPGLTGLLPNSEMNLPRGTHPGRVYPPGSEVKVQVGRIEPKRKRITLVPEGAKIEGSRTDYKEYKKKSSSSGGMPTLAAAFEKLKKDDE